MENIDLQELWNYFLSKFVYVIIAIVLVVVLGNTYNILTRIPLFNSETTVVLVSDNTQIKENTYTQSDVNLNQSLVTTYSEIIKSRTILEKVIRNLKLKYTYDELYKSVTVSNKPDTEIIVIKVSDADKKQAARIANAIVPVFSDEVGRIYGIDNVNVVDRAISSKNPYNINYVKENVLYVFAGVILAAGVIFMIYYFDTSIKSANVVEEKFGLSVLGSVPKVERG